MATAAETRVHGYSSWPAERIVDAVLEGTPIADIPGDFVVTAKRGGHTLLVSSVVAARPYFVAPGGHHGDNVFAVARAAGLPWRWNGRAVRCLATLEHTVGEDTLHADVRRVPACSVLRWDGSNWNVTSQDFWSNPFAGHSTPDDAVEAFRAAVADVGSERPLMGMSAGFDSRAILAGVLDAGSSPVLATMGSPESTDQVIATTVARDLGLEHRAIELRPEDYLTHAPTICRLTGGSKLAAHWHTYLFAAGVRDFEATPLLVGSNGEFARTFFLDKGIVARGVSLAPPQAIRAYFAAKLERHRRTYPTALEGPARLDRRSLLELAGHLGRISGPGSLLHRLDRFYALHRVRHFIGNGLALYSAHSDTRSPFLDGRWISAVARAPRSEKLGSRLHRRTIATCAPQLMRYPIAGESPLAIEPPRGYWRRRKPDVSYNIFNDVMVLPGVAEIVADSPHLDAFLARSERLRLAAMPHRRTIDLLLTLHFAGEEAAA